MAASVLSELRQRNSRDSEIVLEHGEALFKSGKYLRLKGPEVWSFLEQLAFAALDCGRLDLAKSCVFKLDTRFPESPRVAPLKGMLLEGEGRIDMARQFYENELAANEHNVGVRKRLIALHLHCPPAGPGTYGPSTSKAAQPVTQPSVQRGIEMLVNYLDTVYTDVEAWQQLADAYASLGLYEQSLACLGDLILQQPQNAVWQLRYAETAFTMGDFGLAYRSYLRVMELAGTATESGMSRRAALGVKLCLSRLNDDSATSTSGTSLPLHAGAIDALLTKDVLDAYSTEWTGPGSQAVAGLEEQRAVRDWFSAVSSGGATI